MSSSLNIPIQSKLLWSGASVQSKMWEWNTKTFLSVWLVHCCHASATNCWLHTNIQLSCSSSVFSALLQGIMHKRKIQNQLEKTMFLFESLPSNNNQESLSSKWEVLSSDHWEVLLEVSTAVAMETDAPTYLEATKREGMMHQEEAPPPLTTAERTLCCHCVVRAKKTTHCTNCIEFDAFFVMEGVKCAKGGWPSLMFKGNQ